jgi:hypothetical protein
MGFVFTMIFNSIKRKVKRKINSVSNEIFGIGANAVINEIKKAGNNGDLIDALNEEANKPKSVGGATNIYLKQINRDFPDFHNSDAETALKTFISEYLQIIYEQESSFNNSKVDKGLIEQFEISNNYIDVKNIKFNKIAISGYKKTDEYATVTYQCSVGFDINGKREETRYEVNYTLRLLQENIATKALMCSNCGATIESTSHLNCPYCDAKIIRDTIFNWIFSSIIERK